MNNLYLFICIDKLIFLVKLYIDVVVSFKLLIKYLGDVLHYFYIYTLYK